MSRSAARRNEFTPRDTGSCKPPERASWSVVVFCVVLGVWLFAMASSNLVSHAYVYFTNGHQRVVPISNVRNFHPKHEKDFSSQKRYKVWMRGTQSKEDLLLNAFILLLGDSEASVRNKREAGRLKFPNKRNMSFASSASSSPTVQPNKIVKPRLLKSTTKTVRKLKKTHKDAARRDQNNDILQRYEKLISCRTELGKSVRSSTDRSLSPAKGSHQQESPSGGMSDNDRHDSLDSDATTVDLLIGDHGIDDGEPDTQQTPDSADEYILNRRLLRSSNRLRSSSNALEHVSGVSTTHDSGEMVEGQTPEKLTSAVLEAGRKVFLTQFRTRPDTSGTTHSPINAQTHRRELSPVQVPPMSSSSAPRRSSIPSRHNIVNLRTPVGRAQGGGRARSRSLTLSSSPENNSQHNVSYIQSRNNIRQKMIYLDQHTPVSIDAWEMMSTKSDSKFVRDVAVRLWGTEGLANKCLDPAKANKGKDPVHDVLREPLTPDKYEIVKDCLFHKLTEAGIVGRRRALRMSKVWRYISTKIYDVRKKLNLK